MSAVTPTTTTTPSGASNKTGLLGSLAKVVAAKAALAASAATEGVGHPEDVTLAKIMGLGPPRRRREKAAGPLDHREENTQRAQEGAKARDHGTGLEADKAAKAKDPKLSTETAGGTKRASGRLTRAATEAAISTTPLSAPAVTPKGAPPADSSGGAVPDTPPTPTPTAKAAAKPRRGKAPAAAPLAPAPSSSAMEEIVALREQVNTAEASIRDVTANVRGTQLRIGVLETQVEELQRLVKGLTPLHETVKELRVGVHDLKCVDAELDDELTKNIAPMLHTFNLFMDSMEQRMQVIENNKEAESPRKKRRVQENDDDRTQPGIPAPATTEAPPVAQQAPTYAPAQAPAPPTIPAPFAPATPAAAQAPAAALFAPMPGAQSQAGFGFMSQANRARRNYYVCMGPVNTNGASSIHVMHSLLNSLPNGPLFSRTVKDAVLVGDGTYMVGTVYHSDQATGIVDAWNKSRPEGYAQVGAAIVPAANDSPNVVTIQSWNIAGNFAIKMACPDFREDLKKYDINMLQETHLYEGGLEAVDELQEYQMFSVERKYKELFRQKQWGGVVVVARKELGLSVNMQLTSTDVLVLEMDDLVLVAAYILPEVSDWSMFEEASPFDRLVDVMAVLSQSEKRVLIMGDLNARTGCGGAMAGRVRGSEDTGRKTPRGSALIRECEVNGYGIFNGMTKFGKGSERVTSHHAGVGEAVVDYVVGNSGALERTLSMRVEDGDDERSDHSEIVVTYQWEVAIQQEKGQEKGGRTKKRKYKLPRESELDDLVIRAVESIDDV
ncbi:hypothetical protein D9611_009572 [Ephemerocybe angulata]|uniref:Endonuclease/exonuclease/phosphatase domain-containing protein n=1 Tax=Ephemerocybe angulata TaxID=980116 RepID=A0A8H5FGL3_9AGAR|nr:hypothetical protein D9611_009572 [Tulosesus angulatus]